MSGTSGATWSRARSSLRARRAAERGLVRGGRTLMPRLDAAGLWDRRGQRWGRVGLGWERRGGWGGRLRCWLPGGRRRRQGDRGRGAPAGRGRQARRDAVVVDV